MEERRPLYMVRGYGPITNRQWQFVDKERAIEEAAKLMEDEDTRLASVTEERVIWVCDRRDMPCPGTELKKAIDEGAFDPKETHNGNQ